MKIEHFSPITQSQPFQAVGWNDPARVSIEQMLGPGQCYHDGRGELPSAAASSHCGTGETSCCQMLTKPHIHGPDLMALRDGYGPQAINC